MEGLRQYIYSITAAAMLCGILCSLVREGTSGKLLRLICGIYMTLSLLRPLVRLELPDLNAYFRTVQREAQAEVLAGEALASEQKKAFIKAETEAYILDKASAAGLEVWVEVILEDGVPAGAVLEGEGDPSKKEALIGELAEELGIPREQFQWSN